jgi:hypothetical protein
MRRLPALALVLVLLAATASAATASATESGLEGHWWGEGLQPGRGIVNQWLLHLKPDHTFEVEFRFYERCTLKRRSVQSGRWELEGDRYRTVTEVYDGRPYPADKRPRNEYILRKLDDQVMEYHHVALDHTYRALRVPAGYTFPRCLENS